MSKDEVQKAVELGFHGGAPGSWLHTCSQCKQECELKEAGEDVKFHVSACCGSTYTSVRRVD